MNVGIVCYASVGGSGIIATELGKVLATRGHNVHILSSEPPARYGDYQPGLTFHRVDTPSYPLFREPQYLLSLANKIVQVSREQGPGPRARALRRAARHGGVPRQADSGGLGPQGAAGHHDAPRHRHHAARRRPSYSETVAFCIQQSDAVTTVSESLKADTYRELGVTCDIRVIPNFIDASVTAPRRQHAANEAGPERRAARDSRVEFPAGQADDLSSSRCSRACARDARPAADGRRWPGSRRGVAAGQSAWRASDVEFVGVQDQVVPLLSAADVFLLPSEQESFGLAALEAMACEVPVVASRVGGLPEVIEDGVNGFLHALDDLDGMARSTLRLLTDEDLHRRAAAAARQTAEGRYCDSKIVPLDEVYYPGSPRIRSAYEAPVPPFSCAVLGWPGGPPRADARRPDRRGTGPCRSRAGASPPGQLGHLHDGDRASRRRKQRAARDAQSGIGSIAPRLRPQHGAMAGQNEIGPGDVRVARRAPHRGACRAAPVRRRGAVLHARSRFRVLLRPRGNDRQVGSRRDYRRLRAPDSHGPPRRHHRQTPGRARAAASTITRRGDLRARRTKWPGIPRNSRSRSKRVCVHGNRGSFTSPAVRRRQPAPRRRTRPGDQLAVVRFTARQDVLGDRHRSAQHAQVPGTGAAARLARALRPTASSSWSPQFPARWIARAVAVRRRRHHDRRPRAVCGRPGRRRSGGRTRRDRRRPRRMRSGGSH